MKNILGKNKLILFYLIFGLILFLLDFYNQFLIIDKFSIKEYIVKTAVIFNFLWFLLFSLLLISINTSQRKKFFLIITLSFLLFTIINHFKYHYFNITFSLKDISLASEGFGFINSVFKYLNLNFIICLTVIITLIILAFKLIDYNVPNLKYKKLIFIILLLSLFFAFAKFNFYLKQKSKEWDSTQSLTLYMNWVEPNSLIRFGGTYDYIIREFAHMFVKKENKNLMFDEINEKILGLNPLSIYLEEEESIFKDKNLIYVMLESLDDWMVNEQVTPTIYKMMSNGINFSNFYSPTYVTGSTANTEFIANTGIYPNIYSSLPHYSYANNKYPYSLPNLFKKAGYSVNSFHRSTGSIYNRDIMHLSLGFESYNSYLELKIPDENIDLDSSLIKYGYKKIVNKKEKFMSFIITFTPHTPYESNSIKCSTNLDDIKKIYPFEKKDEILCAYSQARETDNMFKILLENLERDNLLEETVIIGFSDHPNNLIYGEDENEKINRTIGFIYNNGNYKKEIDKIATTINLVPAINSLFGLHSNYYYPGYNPLTNNLNYMLLNDFNYYNGKEIKANDLLKNKELLFGKYMLETDYYNVD